LSVKLFFKWISVVLIYPLILFIILNTQITLSLKYFLSAIVILAFLFASIIHYCLSKVCMKEKNHTMIKGNQSKNAELCIVGKNEGENILNILKHYLTFPGYLKITVYDDNSDDGSYENMIDLMKEYPDRLRIKKLIRSSKTLHPKGMGVEEFIKETDADILLINDADTIVHREDFEKAVDYMLEKELDVVHLSRRNDLSNFLSTDISDTEEISNTALKTFGISQWCFPGSGIIINREAANILDYSDFVAGDDLEMGRQLKQHGKKTHHFQTLFAHEKAPTNMKNFFSQRSKWCRNIAYHLLEMEMLGSYLQIAGSALTLFFLFGLFSPVAMLIIAAGIFYTLVGTISNMLFTGRSFYSSFKLGFFNMLQVWIQGAVFTPFYIFIYPLKRKKMDYNKTKN